MAVDNADSNPWATPDGRRCAKELTVVVYDDIQFTDWASVETRPDLLVEIGGKRYRFECCDAAWVAGLVAGRLGCAVEIDGQPDPSADD